MKQTVLTTFAFLALAAFGGCAHIPPGATAVTGFDKTRYLGTWYEIARMDFRFERGLNNTTAEYSVLEGGRIAVRNRGYDYAKREWREAVGTAKFRGSETVGELKVSFFGPFYGAYNVIALDKDYRYALVAGNNLKYLWILSRTKDIPEGVKAEYLRLAKALGYKIDELIWVEHTERVD